MGIVTNITLVAVVLAWQFGAEQMCRFTRAEFLTGCRALKADTCKAIQSRLPELAEKVRSDEELFKDLYRFTYKVTEMSSSKTATCNCFFFVSLDLIHRVGRGFCL